MRRARAVYQRGRPPVSAPRQADRASSTRRLSLAGQRGGAAPARWCGVARPRWCGVARPRWCGATGRRSIAPQSPRCRRWRPRGPPEDRSESVTRSTEAYRRVPAPAAASLLSRPVAGESPPTCSAAGDALGNG